MRASAIGLVAVCAAFLCLGASASTVQPWSIEHPNPALWPIDQDIWDMVANMTLAEKVGQMTQMDITTILKPNSLEIDQNALDNLVENYFIGSVLNSPMSSGPVAGVPNPTPELWQQWITQIQNTATSKGSKVPILYGLDSVHGANYIHGAALFPQQIGAAATFNRSAVELMGAITAKDTRAVGIPWTFSPILGIMTHPLWPRVYETFGEDPFLVSEMGEAIIRGYQGNPFQLNATDRVAACMKHFIGYPATRSGQDRSPSWVPDRILNQYYVPSFRAAIQRAGVRTGMESYNEINGVPVVASHQYLVDMLRNQLGFNGMLVTDWGEIEDLFGLHLVADSLESAVQMSINRTSIDMSMTATDPKFAPLLVGLVQKGLIAQERVDESAARVLQLKKDLGLFENPTPFTVEGHAERIKSIGSDQDRAAALDACHQSVTLVQNNGVLPLAKDLHSAPRGILVSGPSANSIALLAGGWSIHWQGALSDSEFAFGSTILQGVTTYASAAGKPVIYEAGSDIYGNYSDASIEAAVAAAQKTDLTIVAIGEPPYAERIGNIDSIELPYGLQRLVSALVEANATVVLVIVQGRLRTFSHLEPLLPRVAAVLYAYLPGPEGGNCIADILFGVNPSGRLPVSYPGSISKLPMTYFHKNTESPNFLWPFGHGLSYSTFAYSQLQVSPATVLPGTNVSVSVTVTNNGPLDGAHSVLMFLRDNVREVTPEAALLKGFQKLHLAVGQAATVQFWLTTDDLAYYGIDPQQTVIESGTFTVSVGDLSEQFVLALESGASGALSPPEEPAHSVPRDRTRLAPRVFRNRFFR